MLLEKSEELLATKPKEALDVSIVDRRGRNATTLATAKEHTGVVEAIEEHVERLHARFEDVKAQLEQLRQSGRTDKTMEDFMETAKAEILEAQGEADGKPYAQTSGATAEATVASSDEKEATADDEVEEVIIEEDAEAVMDTEDASLDPEEQAMLDRLRKKGYTIAKEPAAAKPVPDPTLREKLATKGYVIEGKPSSKVSVEDNAELQAELSKRAAARAATGSTKSRPTDSVDAELRRRARAKQEL